jgi:hypothetical protein
MASIDDIDTTEINAKTLDSPVQLDTTAVDAMDGDVTLDVAAAPGTTETDAPTSDNTEDAKSPAAATEGNGSTATTTTATEVSTATSVSEPAMHLAPAPVAPAGTLTVVVPTNPLRVVLPQPVGPAAAAASAPLEAGAVKKEKKAAADKTDATPSKKRKGSPEAQKPPQAAPFSPAVNKAKRGDLKLKHALIKYRNRQRNIPQQHWGVLHNNYVSLPALSIRGKAFIEEGDRHPFAFCQVLDEEAKAHGANIKGFVSNYGFGIKTAEGETLRFYDVLPSVVPAALVDKFNASPEMLRWLDGGVYVAGRVYVGEPSENESVDGCIFDMCHDDFTWDDVWVQLAVANGIELDTAKLEVQRKRACYASDVAKRAEERKIVVAQRREEREAKKAAESKIKMEETAAKRAAAAIERAQKRAVEEEEKAAARKEANAQRELARSLKAKAEAEARRDKAIHKAKLILAAAEAGITNLDDVIRKPTHKRATTTKKKTATKKNTTKKSNNSSKSRGNGVSKAGNKISKPKTAKAKTVGATA